MSAARILIVDDQAAIREELAYALSYEGYETTEAADGEAALTALADGEFQVVLLDIKMPGLDGMQVLARLKERWPELLAEVKALGAEKRGLVTDDEFRALAAERS